MCFYTHKKTQSSGLAQIILTNRINYLTKYPVGKMSKHKRFSSLIPVVSYKQGVDLMTEIAYLYRKVFFMNQFQKILNFLGSRFMLNVYVWLLLGDMVYNNYQKDVVPNGYTNAWVHVVIMHVLFMTQIYFTTSVLIARLLMRQKHLMFVGAFLVTLLFFVLVIGNYSEWLIHRYPKAYKYDFIAVNLQAKTPDVSTFFYYVGIAVDLFLNVLIFGMGYFMQYFFRGRRKELAILEEKRLEAELMLLKTQINPHFLFNVLNSIYSLSLKKSDDTPGVVLKLSEILRYMLYESKNDFVSLEKEVTILRDYIDIEKVRMSDKDAIHLEINGDLRRYVIAPNMLISFVENAVKHGLDSQAADAFVIIKIKVDETNDTLYFQCLNNYKQRPRNGHTNKSGGIGLNNVQKRLQLIYGQRHDLDIRNEENLYDVNLQIKLVQHEMSYSR